MEYNIKFVWKIIVNTLKAYYNKISDILKRDIWFIFNVYISYISMFIRSNNILLKDNTFEDIQFFSLQLSLFIFITNKDIL